MACNVGSGCAVKLWEGGCTFISVVPGGCAEERSEFFNFSADPGGRTGES
jgi:hypothetical protein